MRRTGKSATGEFLRVSVAFAAQPGLPARVGFVTSRKVGPAVVRNRVRRRLREIVRADRPALACGCWVVLTAKPAAAAAAFPRLREEWLLLARRLSIFAANSNS